MRVFVAINLPPEERLRLYGAAAPLRRITAPVRWVEPQLLHLTLKFLGEVPSQRQHELELALQRATAGHAPFTLELADFGAFPNLQRSQVYWLGAEHADALHALRSSVEEQFEPLGFPAEARAFHPHLTLGRVKKPLTRDMRAKLAKAGEAVNYRAALPINTVDLMRSHSSSSGSHYERLAGFELSGD